MPEEDDMKFLFHYITGGNDEISAKELYEQLTREGNQT